MRILAFMFGFSDCMLQQTGEKALRGLRHIVHSTVPDEIAHSAKTAMPAPRPGFNSIATTVFHPAFAPRPSTVPPVSKRPDDANCSHPKSASPPSWPVMNRLSTALHALIHRLCPCVVPVHLHLNFTRRVVCTRLQPSNAHFRTYKLGSDISAKHFPISGTGFRISGNPFRIFGIQFRISGTACRILRRGFRDKGTAGRISGGDFLSLGNICLIYGNDFPLSGRVERIHGNVQRLSDFWAWCIISAVVLSSSQEFSV